MKEKVCVFSGNANKDLALGICKKMDLKLKEALVTRFSEGEVRVQIKDNVRGKDVFVIQPTCPPVNDNMMELLIMIDALRRASSGRITAVVPYFGYARQDRKDQPRVPITAKLIANLLTNAGVNRILTMDLHAGQIQGFFDIPLDHLYAIGIFADYFSKLNSKNLCVVSPDVGGIKMARSYAKRLNAGLAIVDKRRISPEQTEVMNILGEIKDRDVVLVDDILATGTSVIEAVNFLKKIGAGNIYVAITHGILSGNAIDKIKSSQIKELVITDTIPLPKDKQIPKIKVLSVAGLLAEAIKRIHKEESISCLFD
ncbi:MAG: ribose-phosphate pyrophosphokinase [Candidatus Gygaella obscura]|nr:ribose-phosphate pyrophosphokinase [Candidatus Gygaella obscura]